MVKEKQIKKAFDNIVCGKILVIKNKENPYIGVLFEKDNGNIIYRGVIKKINKKFDYYYLPIEIYITKKEIKESAAPGQRLPVYINFFLSDLFKLSPYKNKSELEEKIKEIEIKYGIK